MKQEVKSQLKNWTQSVIFKVLVIFFLSLLILISVGQIKSVLIERENRMHLLKTEVIDSWGGVQSIGGPILLVPIVEYYTEIFEGKKELIIKRHYQHILPDELIISAEIQSELRKKGIYDIELYTGNFSINGSFLVREIPSTTFTDSKVLWDEAKLIIGLENVRGLNKKVALKWNNKEYNFAGGTGQSEVFPSGIHSNVVLEQGGEFIFEIKLDLRGGESLKFIPLGEETHVSINSNWPSPGFQGSFLPESHNISGTGFSAVWNIHALARSFPQAWINTNIDWNTLNEGSFGVTFINPIDGYFKNHRAIKYRLMFIFIPFIALFIFEIRTKTKVHPFQYLLAGFSVSMFFLLLISISEHLDFTISYLISAGSSSFMTAAFTSSIFRSKTKGKVMAIINIILYLYLYMSLVSEDYALLIGSLGLFVILALIMIITRKVDWYEL